MENKKEITKKNCGVYALINEEDKIVYIGSSINIKKRFSEHKNFANNTNRNSKVYDYIRKYGNEYFTLQILEFIDSTDDTVLAEQEAYWIENFDEDYTRLNTIKVARSFDRKHLSDAMKGVNKGLVHNKSKHRTSRGLKLYCVELDKYFDSYSDFAEFVYPEIDLHCSKFLSNRAIVSQQLTMKNKEFVNIFGYTLQKA